MREILFHGKRTDNGEWVEGYYFYKYDVSLPGLSKAFILNQDEAGKVLWIEVDPSTVGRYTGLPDKNGVKIFEGDVLICIEPVLYDDIGNERFVVRWDGEEARFNAEIFYLGESQTVNELVKSQSVNYEVIGNIHDNPELIERPRK